MRTENKMIDAEKCKDSGLALVMISLICFLVWKRPLFIPLAIGLLFLAMTYPAVFRPFARCWFPLSAALGGVVSKIILTIIFYLVIVPVALLRKLMGKDSMHIKNWKKGNNSVFRQREQRYEPKDLEHPY
jgi:multisubunit Na+/H+ antiporter MnhG subunit